MGLVALVGAGLWWLSGPQVPQASERAASAHRPIRASVDVVAPPRALTPVAIPAHDASDAGVADTLRVDPTYLEGHAMVRLAPGVDAGAFARDHGVRLVRPVGPAGFAHLDLGRGASGVLARSVVQDDRVVDAAPVARVAGASLTEALWQLASVGLDEGVRADGVVVAVLDSGVAYEDHSDASGDFVAAPSLRSVVVTDPYDFVNDDAHANDDHQHGTHIASVLLGDGEMVGVAPGATLMPVKVLGTDNTGSEVDLIDGIHWALDHGAQVINLSLSFAPDYLPSAALDEALTRARDEGVVVVAATGNDGLDMVSYPAVHPAVIAVAASRLEDESDDDEEGGGPAWGKAKPKIKAADYSNLGVGVDLMAPGGDLGRDEDDDGIADGVLGDAFAVGEPAFVGPYAMAGTSQAAALVSGVAAQLLAAGVAPVDVSYRLRSCTDLKGLAGDRNAAAEDGYGAGSVSLVDALACTVDEEEAVLHVGMLPWLNHKGDKVEPHLELVVLSADGVPVDDAEVFVRVLGGEEVLMEDCKTDSDGRCDVKGKDAKLDEDPAFTFAVIGVLPKDADLMVRPLPTAFTSPELDLLFDELGASQAADVPVGVAWTEGDVEDLGHVADAIAFVHHGTGLASLPLGVVAPRRGLPSGTTTDVALDLATEKSQVELVEFDGTGLASLPVGLRLDRVALLDGTGLASLPVGWRPQDLYLAGVPVRGFPGNAASGVAGALGGEALGSYVTTAVAVGLGVPSPGEGIEATSAGLGEAVGVP